MIALISARKIEDYMTSDIDLSSIESTQYRSAPGALFIAESSLYNTISRVTN